MHAPNRDAEDLWAEIEKLHEQNFAWALVCCKRNRQEAEDVLQTTYLKVLDGRARFSAEGRLKTWLFAVIRRTAAGRRRQRVVREGLLNVVGLFRRSGVADSNPEGEALDSQRGRLLRRRLAGLSLRQRQVLELVFYQDLSIEQAASVLGVTLGTARVHYDRGKKRFAELLALEEGEHELRA
ncbi:MAG: RNA polymerase sigma factor [Deltaproteobacteria bacterium]|nr:RNA polymerase sigma factor [Deltaproteobacteria bacterium]